MLLFFLVALVVAAGSVAVCAVVYEALWNETGESQHRHDNAFG
jgi:hypothetical protein